MSIAENIAQVKQDIRLNEKRFERDMDSVRLLAVSKTKPISDLEEAYQAGQRLFGENYVQEAVDKHLQLAAYQDIEWHFIGPIQSNKSRQIAETMAWVHTIDREKIARRLSEQRPSQLPDLNVLIQVNISDEDSKSGIRLENLMPMVELIRSLPNLRLRGLMAIPAPQVTEADQMQVYQPLKQAFETLKAKDQDIDTLSIGMSGDLSAAIASGSTMVRVGTAIFGERAYTHKD
ncbi:YggS family pyridoxal phosphate-dependent enzyme [Marinomonas piezotolerans]|uniref:Pyridoxal phosphate homeostasis protein n=1 Tax=Marinomonas piezotolerans TaxID=2213058 RepID=A0A370U651_9GAMM|nr:YggS family pyridoxal phosphate-dependent enzyme [Marinomonas piezotolerans]RDL43259.1 YggS family pyridoxal phosphate-dependent enzyme [Marinomonas piezotolerans]